MAASSGTQFCTNCGEQNHADASFCWQCGKAILRPPVFRERVPPQSPEGPPSRTRDSPQQPAAPTQESGATEPGLVDVPQPGPPATGRPDRHASTRTEPQAYAGLWQRIIALLIDHVAVLLFGGSFAYLAGFAVISVSDDTGSERTAAAVAAGIVFGGLFLIYFWLGNAYGGTPGKVILGLRVVRVMDRTDLGLGRGLIRTLLWSLVLGFLFPVVAAIALVRAILDEEHRALHDYAADSIVVRKKTVEVDSRVRVRSQERTTTPRKTWYASRWAVAAGAALVVLVVSGAIWGLYGWRAQDSADERRLLVALDDSFERQAQEQARIDATSSPCSSQWAQETAQSVIDTLDAVLRVTEPDSVSSQLERELENFCEGGDGVAYCRALREILVGAVDELGPGESEDVETGCLQELGAKVEARRLQVGDCVLYTAEGVEPTTCSEPHDASVIAVFDVTSGSYPGEFAVFSHADRECPLETDRHTYPTENSWALGERQIACLNE